MPKKISIPHITWRDGRPRFSPSASLRKLGFAGKDLRHENGSWFTAGQALDWSNQLQKEIDQKRGKSKPRGKRNPANHYTVMQLLHDFQHPKLNPRFDPNKQGHLALKSRQGYGFGARTIERAHINLYASPVAALDRPICRNLFERIWDAHGLSTANNAMRTLSAAISWGMLTGRVKLSTNPATKLKMQQAAPRVRFGTRNEILALVEAADAIDLPAIGDSIIAGVWTGQRQTDRLQLIERDSSGKRRIFRQNKTGAIVAILKAPELENRLSQAKQRRAAANIINGHMILNEARWQPYTQKEYNRDFNLVKAEAVKRSGINTLPDFLDLDLRDTAVTWMALAGCEIPEIVSVTGHTLQSATKILKHYLAQHPEMADSAIRKMITWYDDEGETEIGL